MAAESNNSAKADDDARTRAKEQLQDIDEVRLHTIKHMIVISSFSISSIIDHRPMFIHARILYYQSMLRRHPQMASLNQRNLRLALSMLTEDATFDAIKQFCDNVEHLKSMGFKEDIICGSLLKHNCDLSHAITSCLDAS